MTRDEVREIVRDELASWERDRLAALRAASDQIGARLNEDLGDEPTDGPIVLRLKRILRGEE